jgi:hypothetical protein
MKAFTATLVILAAALAQAQTVKMQLSANGMNLGHAVLSQKVGRNGELHQTLKISTDLPGMTSSLDSDMITDRAGRPVFNNSVEELNGKKKVTKMTYTAKALTITTTQNGKTTSVKSAIPKGRLADPSTFWFITSRPKSGATSTYLHYDQKGSKWENKTATYVGDDIVPDTTKKAHHIHHEDGDAWIDDKGMPIRMELLESGVKLIMTRE